MSILDYFKKQPKNMGIDTLIDLALQNEKELSEIVLRYQDGQRAYRGLSRRGLHYGLAEIRARHHQHRMTMTKTDNECLDRISKPLVVIFDFREKHSTEEAVSFFSDDSNLKLVLKALLIEAADQPISKNQIHDRLELAINEFTRPEQTNIPTNNDEESDTESMGMRQ